MKTRGTKLIVCFFTLTMILFLVSAAFAKTKADQVEVVNAPSSPVPVDIVKKTEPMNIQQQNSETIGDGGDVGVAFMYHVPLGKRLVIEYYSCHGTLPEGQNFLFGLYIATSGILEPDMIKGEHYLTSTAFAPPGLPPANNTRVAAGQQVRIYVDPGLYVYAHVIRSPWAFGASNGTATFRCFFSGYLEPAD